MKTLKQWYTYSHWVGGSYYASNTTCCLAPTEARKTNEMQTGANLWLLTEDYEPVHKMTHAVKCDGTIVPASSPAEYLDRYDVTKPRGMQLLEEPEARRMAA